MNTPKQIKLGGGIDNISIGEKRVGLGRADFSIGPAKKDPLEEALPGETTEQYSERLLNAAQLEFKKTAQGEQAKWLEAVDSEHWCCLCFQSREQKDEFLQNSGLLRYGDKYLDGRKVAKYLQISLGDVQFPYKAPRINKNLVELVRPTPKKKGSD